MKKFPWILTLIIGLIATSCATIRPGEVAMKQRFGELTSETREQGVWGYNPFTTRIIKLPTRTVNKEVRLDLPSKDGLNVRAEISILYRIDPSSAPSVVKDIGRNYENVVILSVFRSAAADVCSRFLAKDMYTESRAEIEGEILKQMDKILAKRGFVIESVLMKSIQLPAGLTRAIEDKLEAEQLAQRMEFELQREEMEAKRKVIEAEGIRDAQKIIAQGLSDKIIKWQTIDAFSKLANSSNSKLIITDGKSAIVDRSPG